VIDELRFQPNVREAEIGVAAREGVVTLTGFVPSYPEKVAAVRAAERVFGVRAVADDLTVRLPGTAQRSDTDIAHAAVEALKWNVEVPDTAIKLTVKDGWITMEGDVDWEFQRRAADRSVRFLTGVKGVVNRVTVHRASVSALEVQRHITDALKRSATVDAQRISVEARDGRVVLRGKVRSWAERTDAEAAAWAAPGVSAVEDDITVGV
jgi:osmotically-inducible protein OsmY